MGIREGALLKYASSAQYPIDEDVVAVLERDAPQVFLPFKTFVRSSEVTGVDYEVGDMITLAAHLRAIRGRGDVRGMLANFQWLIESCVELGLPLKNLELDYERVFYDSRAKMLKFVYLPFAGVIPDVNKVRVFFEGVPSQIGSADDAATGLLSSYSQYFAASSMFNPVDFANTLGALCASSGQSDLPTGQVALAGGDADSNTTNLQSGIPVGAEIHDRPRSSAKGTAKAKTKIEKEGRSGTEPEKGAHARVDPGTTVLGELTFDFSPDSDGTGVLGDLPFNEDDLVIEGVHNSELASAEPDEELEMDEPEPKSEQNPESKLGDHKVPLKESWKRSSGSGRTYWLHRRATDERVRVTGERFVVGKSKYSTYQVRHTTTVSRSHAIFTCDDGGCWIEDDGSRNGTYLDNRKLDPHVKEKLEDGMVIRMSDEEFEFSEKNAD